MLQVLRSKCFKFTSWEGNPILSYQTLKNGFAYQGKEGWTDEKLLLSLLNSFEKDILPDFFMRYVL